MEFPKKRLFFVDFFLGKGARIASIPVSLKVLLYPQTGQVSAKYLNG
jgi:hypothetical protein